MEKKWVKQSERVFAFFADGRQEALFEYKNAALSKAEVTAGDDVYAISRTGFWKSNIEITLNGRVIATTSGKWLSGKSVLQYRNSTFTIKLKNNPLAEWQIYGGEKLIASYGLNAEGTKITTRITGDDTDFIFDYLLWFLYMPICLENNDSMIMSLLMLNF